MPGCSACGAALVFTRHTAPVSHAVTQPHLTSRVWYALQVLVWRSYAAQSGAQQGFACLSSCSESGLGSVACACARLAAKSSGVLHSRHMRQLTCTTSCIPRLVASAWLHTQRMTPLQGGLHTLQYSTPGGDVRVRAHTPMEQAVVEARRKCVAGVVRAQQPLAHGQRLQAGGCHHVTRASVDEDLQAAHALQ